MSVTVKLRVIGSNPKWKYFCLVFFYFLFINYRAGNLMQAMMMLYQVSSGHELFMNTHCRQSSIITDTQVYYYIIDYC